MKHLHDFHERNSWYSIDGINWHKRHTRLARKERDEDDDIRRLARAHFRRVKHGPRAVVCGVLFRLDKSVTWNRMKEPTKDSLTR
jgi:hypothetical protein